MTIDTKELRELAQKATPGHWYSKWPEERCTWVDVGNSRYPVAYTGDCFDDRPNAEYIAAANPATVLALLDDLAAMRENLNDARSGWEQASAELNDAAQCIANQCQTIGQLQRELADMSVINSIDDRFGGRLAFMLECAILDPHGCFDEACRLLDDYRSEWEKVSPSPPTFMGEPMPPERELAMNQLLEALK